MSFESVGTDGVVYSELRQFNKSTEVLGKFDPERFDSTKASRKMRRGMVKGKDAD
jgi:hypothetical protein